MWLLWAMILAASPTPRVDGGIPLADVRELLDWHSAEINDCLAGSPKGALVHYRFTVTPRGNVGQLSFLASQRVESPRITCVGTALEKWRFPATDGGAVVEWPFSITSFDAGTMAPDSIPPGWVDDAVHCYDASYPSEATEGRLGLQLFINRDGGVARAKVMELAPELALSDLSSCLERAASAWSWPGSPRTRRARTDWIFAMSGQRAKLQFSPGAPAREAVARNPLPGGLDKEVIFAEILRASPSMKACYELGLSSRRDLGGKFAVAWQIAPDGHVLKTEVTDDELQHEPTTRCLLNVVERMQFPAPHGGGLVNVTFPWIFKAAGE